MEEHKLNQSEKALIFITTISINNEISEQFFYEEIMDTCMEIKDLIKEDESRKRIKKEWDILLSQYEKIKKEVFLKEKTKEAITEVSNFLS